MFKHINHLKQSLHMNTDWFALTMYGKIVVFENSHNKTPPSLPPNHSEHLYEVGGGGTTVILRQL